MRSRHSASARRASAIARRLAHATSGSPVTSVGRYAAVPSAASRRVTDFTMSAVRPAELKSIPP